MRRSKKLKNKPEVEVEVAEESSVYNPETGMLYGDITSTYMSMQGFYRNNKK